MSKTKTQKLSMAASLMIVFLAFGAFAGAAAIVTKNQLSLAPVTLADEGEDDEDKDEDEDKDDDKDNKDDDDDKAKEALEKKAERARESAKKQLERSNKNSNDDSKDDNDSDEDEGDDDGDENEGDDMDEDEDENGDDNGMFKDRAKTLSKLQEKIDEAAKEIAEKGAEGVDVTAALARLALAKSAYDSVSGAFDANNLDEAKRLAKEARKLTHFAKEEDLHNAKEVAEDAAKVSKRITQAYGKITLFEAVGGDGNAFKSSLAALEADLAALRATIASGSYDPETMSDSLEMLEKKVKSLKNGIEGAIYALGGTDSEFDNDFEDESEDIAEHLNDVADIEDDGVGRVIRRIADDHKDAAKKVGETVKDVDKRNPVLQTLFGASESDLNDLEQEIAANKARTAALLQAVDAIEDADVKAILLDQVAVLQAQTARLEMFVGGQRDRLSVFGWLFNLF